MERLFELRTKTTGYGKSLVRVSLRAMAVAFVAVAALVLPSVPHLGLSALAKTSEEIAGEISEKEASIGEYEDAVSDAQEALATEMRESYKSGDLEATKTWEMILASESVEQLLTSAQYLTAMTQRQAQTIAEAQGAMARLSAERDDLTGLRHELETRLSARENWDDGKFHFCQWGESWSSLPYYVTGSVGADGCGLCAYTTMVDLLTGSDYDPGEMLALRGDWAGLEEQLDWTNGTPDGSTHREWTKATFDIDLSSIGNTVAACKLALSEPETVLLIGPMGCTMHDRYGSTRWTNGHYVCVYRCDENGFYVHDSAYSGEAGTAVYYTDAEMQRMLDTWDIVTKASN